MTLEELKSALEDDDLIQRRDVKITLGDDWLKVEEYGNPDIEVDESGDKPKVVGDSQLTRRVEDLAKEVLGVGNYYAPTAYADEERSHITIRT